jgi:hypothetical protein
METTKSSKIIDAESLTILFTKLKDYYGVSEVSEDRKTYIRGQVNKYGYLPYSFYRCLHEVTPAEALIGIEEKCILNGTFKDGKFVFDESSISPVRRAGFTDSSWLTREQLNVKLVNLAALGNGNENQFQTGRFHDWIRQLLVVSSGKPDFQVLGTVMYFVPFHPRDFGCAYLPKSKFISDKLEDTKLSEALNTDLKEQVKLFFQLCQLAGHPVMYDVLPQSARYSATVLSKPWIARWYDIPELNKNLRKELDIIARKLEENFNSSEIETVKALISNSLDGASENTPYEAIHIEERMEQLLDDKRRAYSEEMTSKECQQKLVKKVKEIIADVLDTSPEKELTEEDVVKKHYDIIGTLISKGLWPAPGGAWCSCGIPVYDRMVSGAGHPLFKHYDVNGNDVTAIANLDCQTPFYFVFLESGEHNQPVIDFWADFLVELQQEYNFDGFRVDHIDHIVDKVSQTPDGKPISYRAPASVLRYINDKLREANPTFGLLAEYMLWEGFLKEYHQDMRFDLLWGADIVSQDHKNVKTIIKDNHQLAYYNSKLPECLTQLSILKTYNNQDGEFREIDQYPAQMEASGALFKWFKYKFLPETPLAERPSMFIDGDESFTRTGVERVIGEEISMTRNNDEEFFRKFDAINRFALNNIFTRYGVSEIWHGNETGTGLIAWCLKKQPAFGDDERLFIVANENPPRQVLRKADNEYQLYSVLQEYQPVYNASIHVPDGFTLVSEYVLPMDSYEFIETFDVKNHSDHIMTYDKLDNAEFHIYKIKRIN